MEPINKDLLRKVREEILAHPNNFKYAVYLDCDITLHMMGKIRVLEICDQLNKHTCGTVACVAGWVVALESHKSELLTNNHGQVYTVAKKVLNLTYDEAQFLFLGYGMDTFRPIDLSCATVDDAVKRIDYLLNLEESDRDKHVAYDHDDDCCDDEDDDWDFDDWDEDENENEDEEDCDDDWDDDDEGWE